MVQTLHTTKEFIPSIFYFMLVWYGTIRYNLEYPISYPEFLDISHELNQTKRDEEIENDKRINFTDFILEPQTLLQILINT